MVLLIKFKNAVYINCIVGVEARKSVLLLSKVLKTIHTLIKAIVYTIIA